MCEDQWQYTPQNSELPKFVGASLMQTAGLSRPLRTR
jgi:hypothetical protein